MIPSLKSFITSEICLDCDGCCRFNDKQSDWRAKMALEEEVEAINQSLANDIFSKDVVKSNRFIETRACSGEHLCSFFNSSDHTCSIYQARPFECQLYPFVLSKERGQIKLYVHLSCPFVQDHLGQDHYLEYVKYLEGFFKQKDVLDFLQKNSRMLSDYSSYADELSVLFEIKSLRRLNVLNDVVVGEAKSLAVSSIPFLFVWGEYFDYQRFNESILAYNTSGCFTFLPNFTNCSEVDLCFEKMEDLNQGNGVSRLEHVPQKMLSIIDGDKYEVSLQGQEYVYFKNDIVQLTSNAYKSKRHDLNQFLKSFSSEYRDYQKSDFEDCVSLYDQWAKQRSEHNEDDEFLAMVEDNRAVHQRILQNYEKLGMIGRIVEVDGKIAAYSFGFPMTSDMFCVILEITNPEVRGLPVFIFQQFCADEALMSFSFINVMDDSGLPNLKQTKLSYRPAILEPFYLVKRK